MSFNLKQATDFVKAVDLRGIPRGLVELGAETDAGEVFDKAKTQAQVVGSGVFSFAEGVTADVREAISDSALLAQLVANKKTPVEQDPVAWFKTYSEVLQNVGWTLQVGQWDDYTAKGNAAEVHDKILEVLTAALGPTAAAVAIVTATVKALQGMNANSPWITLFNRESQRAKIARFQVGLVEKNEQSDVFVSLLVCLIKAEETITQVLFFKYRAAKAHFEANGAKVSINRAALADLGPAIRTKVRAYQKDYLSSILDVPLT